MQVKIIIGTVAFMLTMIILGLVALTEPARLEAFTAAYSGRSVESGAALFAANCATCHGLDGKAEACLDANGEPISCLGRPLNNRNLVCGEPSRRMEELLWVGSKEAFVRDTIASGRTLNGMPTWSQQYGGPLQEDQVRDLTLFVLNFEHEELCAVAPFFFPWPGLLEGDSRRPEAFDEFLAMTLAAITLEEGQEINFTLPVTYPGDAERGKELYGLTYGCNACHGDPEGDPSTALIGPWQGDIANVGGTRLEGYSAEQYLYESILNPAAFTVPECPSGPCSSSGMPNTFADRMSENPQDLADIITYLMQQTNE